MTKLDYAFLLLGIIFFVGSYLEERTLRSGFTARLAKHEEEQELEGRNPSRWALFFARLERDHEQAELDAERNGGLPSYRGFRYMGAAILLYQLYQFVV